MISFFLLFSIITLLLGILTIGVAFIMDLRACASFSTIRYVVGLGVEIMFIGALVFIVSGIALFVSKIV